MIAKEHMRAKRSSLCRACTSLESRTCLKIPDNLPQTQDMPVRITARAPAEGAAPATQAPEDEARDILAAATPGRATTQCDSLVHSFH